MEKLAQARHEKVIDLLNERLTFERAGVRLYDSVLEKMQASRDENILRMYDEMQSNRDDEKEHEEWLETQLRDLGSDTHLDTDLSRLVQIESSGIEKIVLDGDNVIPHLFHALLIAELVDNAGWDLLVQLAEDVGDLEMKRAFKKRLHQEEDHLIFVRKAVERFARGELTGERVTMPKDAGILGKVFLDR
jgi:bacterioferritin (cytochrome b1)